MLSKQMSPYLACLQLLMLASHLFNSENQRLKNSKSFPKFFFLNDFVIYGRRGLFKVPSWVAEWAKDLPETLRGINFPRNPGRKLFEGFCWKDFTWFVFKHAGKAMRKVPDGIQMEKICFVAEKRFEKTNLNCWDKFWQ